MASKKSMTYNHGYLVTMVIPCFGHAMASFNAIVLPSNTTALWHCHSTFLLEGGKTHFADAFFFFFFFFYLKKSSQSHHQEEVCTWWMLEQKLNWHPLCVWREIARIRHNPLNTDVDTHWCLTREKAHYSFHRCQAKERTGKRHCIQKHRFAPVQ